MCGEHAKAGRRSRGLVVASFVAVAVSAAVSVAVGGERPIPGGPSRTLGSSEAALSGQGLAGSEDEPATGSQTGAAVAALAASVREIDGTVTSPVLGRYDPPVPPATFALTFAGSVNAHPDEWHIEVDVLRSADADPAVEANWERNVAQFEASSGGPEIFKFSESGVKPFAGLPDAWKTGGLGRLRVVAAMDADPSQRAPLKVLDIDGRVPANATTIVLADTAPDPTKPPGQDDRTISQPLNPATPNYLSYNAEVLSFKPGPQGATQLQKATAEAYYAQIRTNPDGTGPSISQSLDTLEKFIDRYFAKLEPPDILDVPETMAKYFNEGDLGIGREMHCINRGRTAELACYVKNFGKPDGTPIFDDKQEAKKALKQNRPFATVAMVERQRMGPRPNRVFFIVYEHVGGSGDPANTRLATEAKLDNKGYNTSIPGNCLQCHGINSRYTAHARHQVTGAMFLPFDLDAFSFFSQDRANPLSRAAQEEQFRTLNLMVRSKSSLAESADARELIAGWYGGPDLPRGAKFNGDFVPSGWRANAHQRQLYRKLYAVGCRTCHISYLPSETDKRKPYLKFSTFAEFTDPEPSRRLVLETLMCRSHGMPAAEQTLKKLWQSAGRAHYFGQVPGRYGECGLRE